MRPPVTEVDGDGDVDVVQQLTFTGISTLVNDGDGCFAAGPRLSNRVRTVVMGC